MWKSYEHGNLTNGLFNNLPQEVGWARNICLSKIKVYHQIFVSAMNTEIQRVGIDDWKWEKGKFRGKNILDVKKLHAGIAWNNILKKCDTCKQQISKQHLYSLQSTWCVLFKSCQKLKITYFVGVAKYIVNHFWIPI